MILSVVKGLLTYVNVSQEHWTGFFLYARSDPPSGLAVGGWEWVKKPFTVALLDRVRLIGNKMPKYCIKAGSGTIDSLVDLHGE
jgi:hypothetical protein